MRDISSLRNEFPILEAKVHGKPLVYFDNAATTQKPHAVLNAISDYYVTMNSNIHRGVHTLSEKATEAFEGSRKTVAGFIGADDADEVVFTSGATDSVNMVAYGFGEDDISAGDEIVVSIMEHHSNLVPWQELCRRKRATLKFIRLNEARELDLSGLDELITGKTKMVAVTAMSNALGSITDLKPIIKRAHDVGAKVLVDSAQSVPHFGVNVKELDADFLVFSAHKMLGPTGVGVLWGRKELLEKMRPFKFGGDMISEVKEQSSKWNETPYKFEAGTPNIEGVIAFDAAIRFLNDVGMEEVSTHCSRLAEIAMKELSKVPGVRIFSPKENNGGTVSFAMDGVHPHDIGSILDEEGVAIRAGHHCTQPLMEALGVPALARMSFYIYNTEQEIETAVMAVSKVNQIFKMTS